MKILALDTSTEACSAAIFDGEANISRYQLAPREHNNLILPMIEEVLAEGGYSINQMDAVAFGRGPGSFTGVRIAAGVAQGVAFGADLPVIPVSTLAALSLAAMGSGVDTVYACIDARMSEVYWAVYRRESEHGVSLTGAEVVCPPEAVIFPSDSNGIGVGSGWETYETILSGVIGSRLLKIIPARFPDAQFIARVASVNYQQGRVLPAEYALPVYLRDNVAKKPGQT